MITGRCGDATPASSGAVLLTGATGFVGMELLARYLERTDRTVYALIRAEDDEDAERRLRETLENVCGNASNATGRAIAVAGDITREGLGLDFRSSHRVAQAVDEIVHGAASVSFDLGLAESRLANVEGTRNVLGFAARCRGLRRLSYISTAYVAGEHSGAFREDELALGQRFRNPYEQSKYEAEQLIASQCEHLPITVLRPSIIVGDSVTGWTASFNVLYWPLRALARGAYPVLPARRGAPVDVVPVDYVADAILALTQAPGSEGRTFHLTASAAASTIGELLDLACEGLGCRKPPVVPPRLYRRVMHPLLLRARPRLNTGLRASETYLPYFAMDVHYDDARSRTALAPAGIRPPPLADYFDRLLDYALTTRWGRRPVSRASRQAERADPPASPTGSARGAGIP